MKLCPATQLFPTPQLCAADALVAIGEGGIADLDAAVIDGGVPVGAQLAHPLEAVRCEGEGRAEAGLRHVGIYGFWQGQAGAGQAGGRPVPVSAPVSTMFCTISREWASMVIMFLHGGMRHVYQGTPSPAVRELRRWHA